MSGWHPVSGKPGIYVHDDAPACEVEILAYTCGDCGEERTTMHSVHDCDGHSVATEEERKVHATCRCGRPMQRQTEP